MGALLGFSAMIGFLVCVIMLVVSVIKKNGNVKKWAIGIAICFVGFIIALNVPSSPTSKTTTTANSSAVTPTSTTAKTPEQIAKEKADADAAAKQKVEADAAQVAKAQTGSTPATNVSTPVPTPPATAPASTSIPVPAVSTTAVDTSKQDTTVYITETGKKYHNDGCRTLSKGKTAISLADAKAKGYTPCGICKPPQ